MKLTNFFSIGLVSAIISLLQPAWAGSSSYEDFVQPQGACMVQVNDVNRARVINVEYIRLVQVENKEPNTLHISMASNYYNSSTDQLKIIFSSNVEAIKVLQELTDRINDCQYNAAKKRKTK